MLFLCSVDGYFQISSNFHTFEPKTFQDQIFPSYENTGLHERDFSLTDFIVIDFSSVTLTIGCKEGENVITFTSSIKICMISAQKECNKMQ
jgi:hypothetical protein